MSFPQIDAEINQPLRKAARETHKKALKTHRGWLIESLSLCLVSLSQYSVSRSEKLRPCLTPKVGNEWEGIYISLANTFTYPIPITRPSHSMTLHIFFRLVFVNLSAEQKIIGKFMVFSSFEALSVCLWVPQMTQFRHRRLTSYMWKQLVDGFQFHFQSSFWFAPWFGKSFTFFVHGPVTSWLVFARFQLKNWSFDFAEVSHETFVATEVALKSVWDSGFG